MLGIREICPQREWIERVERKMEELEFKGQWKLLAKELNRNYYGHQKPGVSIAFEVL